MGTTLPVGAGGVVVISSNLLRVIPDRHPTFRWVITDGQLICHYWGFGNWKRSDVLALILGLARSDGKKYGRCRVSALRLPEESNPPLFFGINAPIGKGNATIKTIISQISQISRSKADEIGKTTAEHDYIEQTNLISETKQIRAMPMMTFADRKESGFARLKVHSEIRLSPTP